MCRQFDILKKWQATLDASPGMAGRTSRIAGPIRPFPGSNTPAKVLQPLFSVLKPVCHKRWPYYLFCFFPFFLVVFLCLSFTLFRRTWVAGVPMLCLSYPLYVRWNDIALSTLLTALRCSISVS